MLERNGVSRERLSVVPPAVRDGGPAPARRRGDGDPLVIGYAGNLDAYQDLNTLAAAAAEIARSRPAVLSVATHAASAAEVDGLRRAAGGCVVELAEAADYAAVRAAMARADVLVCPRPGGSGFPIKMLNYMSLGRPVVTAGCGAKAVEDGRSGLVVADGDPRAMAAAIGRIAADPASAEALGRGARRRFLDHYTWDPVARAVESIYDRVCPPVPLPAAARPRCGLEG